MICLWGNILLTGGALFTGGFGGRQSLGVKVLSCKYNKYKLYHNHIPHKNPGNPYIQLWKILSTFRFEYVLKKPSWFIKAFGLHPKQTPI